MTRFSATAVILFCLAFSIPLPGHSQSDRSWATDNGCFPWQDFKKGQCVAKPSQAPLLEPAPSPVVTAPVVTAPPAVAPSPPVVASPPPADIVTRTPETNVVCEGGTLYNGACTCPTGFNLVPAPGNAGGTCVRTNAENCLGGQLTVDGKCLCNGHVTMTGETYLLEYSNGKCLPTRCTINAALRDGRCVASSSPQLGVEPEPNPKPAAKEAREAKEASQDFEPRHHCGRGMMYTRSGCVPAHRRVPDMYRQYYRYYQFPGLPN